MNRKMTITGKVEWQDIGTGTWALVSDDGETYELKDPPTNLTQTKGKVTVEGTIRDDVMTIAMIGPVLDVSSFEALES